MANLSAECVPRMYLSPPNAITPLTLQVVDVKKIQNTNKPDVATRYRLIVNDGRYTTGAMTASQLNQLVEAGTVRIGSILEVQNFISSAVQNRKIIILLQFTVVGHHPEKIGNPVEYNPATDGGVPAPHQAPPAPAAQPYGSSYGQMPPAQPMGAYGSNAGPSNPNTYPQSSTYGGNAPYAAHPQQPPHAAPYSANPAPSNPFAPPSNPPYNPAPPAANSYQAPRQPYAAYSNQGGPVPRMDAPPRLMPIKAVSPYQSRWTIMGRCSVKSDVRRFSNVRGEGKLFNFDLVDAEGGEIRVTGFGPECDKFFELIEMGKVYTVSKARVQPKKAAYNNTSSDYEITLDRNSVVEKVDDNPETSAIPYVIYNFKKLADLESAAAGSIVDVVGVVESVDAWQTITTRRGDETQKRSVTLRDDSGRSIELTLWGAMAREPGDQLEQAVRNEGGPRPLVAAKSVRVGDFNGKTLSSISSSQVAVDANHPTVAALRAWWQQGGSQVKSMPLSERGASGAGSIRSGQRVALSSILNDNLGRRTQGPTGAAAPDYVTVAATVQFIKNDPGTMYYPACTRDHNGRMCNKKLLEATQGQWSCERCNADIQSPEWRYMLSMTVVDHTQQQWLNAFGDAGDVIMGMPAEELRRLEMDDPQRFDAVLQGANFRPLLFRIKVAEETYNDETRVKATVQKVEAPDFAKEARQLVDCIHKLEKGEPVLTPPPPQAAAGAGFPGGSGAPGTGGGYGAQNAGGYQSGAPQQQYSHQQGYAGNQGQQPGAGGYQNGGGFQAGAYNQGAYNQQGPGQQQQPQQQQLPQQPPPAGFW